MSAWEARLVQRLKEDGRWGTWQTAGARCAEVRVPPHRDRLHPAATEPTAGSRTFVLTLGRNNHMPVFRSSGQWFNDGP